MFLKSGLKAGAHFTSLRNRYATATLVSHHKSFFEALPAQLILSLGSFLVIIKSHCQVFVQIVVLAAPQWNDAPLASSRYSY